MWWNDFPYSIATLIGLPPIGMVPPDIRARALGACSPGKRSRSSSLRGQRVALFQWRRFSR